MTSSVRVTEDNLLYAVDLAMVVTGADRNYANQVNSQYCILQACFFPSLQIARVEVFDCRVRY